MVKRTFNSLKNLLVKEQNEIISAATVLMILGFITKVVGLLQQSLITKQFGATSATDSFYLASIVPEMITNVILLGAISGSIIPIFVKLKEKEGEQAFLKSFSSTLNLSMGIFVLLSIAAAVFAKQLIPLAIKIAGPGSVAASFNVSEVTLMMRLLIIPQIILAISAFASTSLNIYHRFIIPQLAPLIFNLGRIIGILFFVPMMDGSIWGLIWGTLLGAFLHLLIQLPLLRRLQIRFNWLAIDFKDLHFIQVIKLGLPRVMSLSVEQLAVVVDSIIALGLTIGSLSVYSYSVRLISFPLSLFGTSYAIAAFPSMSKLYAQGAKVEFAKLVEKIINQVIFLTLPVSVLMLVLRVPIVRLIYGIYGGNFDWQDTLQVAWVVMFFSLGLTFESLRGTMFRIYYSVHNSVIPFISSVLVVFFGIVSGILFTNYLSHFEHFSLRDLTFNLSYFFSKGQGVAGIGGLGLSSSLVFSLEFFFLLLMLKKVNAITDIKGLLFSLFKKLLAGLIMLILAYAMSKLWEEVLNTAKTLSLILLTSTTMLAAFMIYLWTSFVLNIPEVEIFIEFVLRNIKKLLNK